ncbi:MAG TPA: Crp/Fnr family transcriptional regulator [Pseudolabrys sp.]
MSPHSHGHRGNRLLLALPADAQAALKRDMREAIVAQGAVLLEPNDLIAHVYFPQSGIISRAVVMRDGGALETSMVGREGAVGLHRGPGRSFTRATVQVAGTISVIAVTPFQQVLDRYPALRALVAEYGERSCLEARQLVACNAVHDASSRLCRRLLQCADRIDDDVLPLTQEFLAQMLGVRRTTLTLLAQALQERGAIHYCRARSGSSTACCSGLPPASAIRSSIRSIAGR